MKNDLSRAYDFGADFTFKLINVSENQTFRIDKGGQRHYALRLARPGYHTLEELNSELAWLEALSAENILSVAKPMSGRDGNYIQQITGHNAVLFEWIDGLEPKITDNLMGLAEQLGCIAARLHNHVLQWEMPATFIRPRWDFDAALGGELRWGDWRQGLGVQPHMIATLVKTVDAIEQRLKIYGETPQRFNLIHGDLRLANLLQSDTNLTLIDFDDCGHSWLMYDAATMISFHEHEPQAEGMITNWIEGYKKIRPISVEDEAVIHTLIIFRRILLLAWLGTHCEIDLARQVKNSFAHQTVQLCENYLKNNSVF